MGYWLTGKDLDKFRLNGTTVGDTTKVAPDAFIDMNYKCTVGEHCMMAAKSMVLGHDAATNTVGLPTVAEETVLGNNVFMGVYSIVLVGRHVGDNVIIGAYTVVTKVIPSNQVWAGNPARFVCTLEEYKRKHVIRRNGV